MEIKCDYGTYSVRDEPDYNNGSGYVMKSGTQLKKTGNQVFTYANPVLRVFPVAYFKDVLRRVPRIDVPIFL